MAKNRSAGAVGAGVASQAWQVALPWLAGLVLGGGAALAMDAVGAGRWLAAPLLSCVAVLLGLVGFALARGRGQPRGDAMVDRISGEIDHIMIGAAETSFFVDTIKNIFMHVRAIRRMTIAQSDRASRSIVDHMRIIEALEQRDTERVEQLVRQHSIELAYARRLPGIILALDVLVG